MLSRHTRSYDIWLITPGGEKLREAISEPGDEQNPRWSPDGTRLVFHRLIAGRGYQVWTYDLVQGALTYIDDGLTPAWSPDGRSLVYARKKDGNWDIYTRLLDTGQTRRLTTHRAREQYPYWGLVAGREKILFASQRTGVYEIWEMDTDGGNKRRLSDAGEATGNRMIGPVLSPDGTRIAFWEIDYVNDHSVWLMNADGT